MSLRILYNGACPICSREIALYRRLVEKTGAKLVFEDLNTADLRAWGLSPDQARRRLHAREGAQQLVGVAAFRALWSHLPGWRWLARLIGLPGISYLAEVTYDRIAAPWLYRRSCRAQTCRVN
jgi:predicted DCC family thiol-disulfide oxidoreductase YuxK